MLLLAPRAVTVMLTAEPAVAVAGDAVTLKWVTAGAVGAEVGPTRSATTRSATGLPRPVTRS